MRATNVPLFGLLFLLAAQTLAHSPHDDIDAIALSPTYSEDGVVFAIVGGHVKRSTDGGYSWKELVNGLDNRDQLTALALSGGFGEDSTVFAAAGRDGVYRSTDGGESWQQITAGLAGSSVDAIVVDPDFPASATALVIGSDGQVYRSEDRGESWARVSDLPDTVTQIRFADSKAPGFVAAGDDSGGIWTSEDSGASWQMRSELPQRITALAVSGRLLDGVILFAGTSAGQIYRQDSSGQPFVNLAGLQIVQGTYETADRARHWNRDERAITGIAVSPRYALDGTIFVSTWNEALFRSTDRGRTWTHLGDGLSTDAQANDASYLSPQFRDVRVSESFGEDGTVLVAGFDGLFKSDEGGKEWTQMETLPVSLIKALEVTRGQGSETAIAISTYGAGGYVSPNGGATWTIATEGLVTTRLDGLAFSPEFSADSILFAAANRALLRSENGGESWVLHEPGYSWRIGLSRRLRHWGLGYVAEWVLAEDERGERPYPTAVAVSPGFSSDRTVFFATRRHGIWVSNAAGAEAVRVLDTSGVTSRSLAISPSFERDGTVFAALRGGEIYSSADRGLTWTLLGRVVPSDYSMQAEFGDGDFALDVMLEISADYENDRTVYAHGPFGVRKSTDGGRSWSPLSGLADAPNPRVTDLGLSPEYASDQTMLVALRGEGLRVSRDGGASFQPVLASLLRANQEIEHVALSPYFASDRLAYVASEEALFQADLERGNWREITRPVRYENRRDALRYTGEWEGVWDADSYREEVSEQPGASVSLHFVGPGIVWRGTHGPSGGRASVAIDGQEYGVVSQAAEERQRLQETFAVRDLSPGSHTLSIRVVGDGDGEPSGEVSVDAFDVFGAVMTDRSAAYQ